MTSLFIGRYQPFHEGHKTLMETVLKTGGSIVIALRDTPIASNNPFTIEERTSKIQEVMKEWGDKVKIISIPDIDEVCYGRGVGYKIREIHLSPEIEAISATKIREQL